MGSGLPDEKKKARQRENLKLLKSGAPLRVPDCNKYPLLVREIFEYYKGVVNDQDLRDFADGTFYKENLINLYFKILEKMSLVI